ncbi:hypothetical protein ACTXT7_006713 [Hymenolepis weldensis]
MDVPRSGDLLILVGISVDHFSKMWKSFRTVSHDLLEQRLSVWLKVVEDADCLFLETNQKDDELDILSEES